MCKTGQQLGEIRTDAIQVALVIEADEAVVGERQEDEAHLAAADEEAEVEEWAQRAARKS